MKKLIVLSVVGLLTLSSFGVKENKKEVVIRARYVIYCSGVYAGTFSCDGCDYMAIAREICGY